MSCGRLNYRISRSVSLFDNRVAFTAERLQRRPVKYRDMSTLVLNYSKSLQIAGSLGDALTPDTQHVGDQFLRHN
jgi:hypothetical protein